MPNSEVAQTLSGWIRDWMSRELGLTPGAILSDKTFVQYGMDSVHAMMLVGDLEEHLARRLPPTLAWDHPTVESLARHLAETSPNATEPITGKDVGADDLLAQLDDLSEEAIDRLLEEQQVRSSQD